MFFFFCVFSPDSVCMTPFLYFAPFNTSSEHFHLSLIFFCVNFLLISLCLSALSFYVRCLIDFSIYILLCLFCSSLYLCWILPTERFTAELKLNLVMVVWFQTQTNFYYFPSCLVKWRTLASKVFENWLKNSHFALLI